MSGSLTARRARHTISHMTEPAALGLLLAAGAGSRMGRPKALVTGHDGRPWLHTAIDALRDGGCDHVLIVLGAEAERAERLIAQMAVSTVVAQDWQQGMSASLRTGLVEALGRSGDFGAVVISLVDLPDVDSRVVARVIAKVGIEPSALGRAVYDGTPGHPVVIGMDHIDGVLETIEGDQGARHYLRETGLTLVECSDLATGADVDSR